jgi:hypothetical protein
MFFYLKYLFGIRWLFHGQFSGQDHWMVSETDAPPERLYRPDISIIEWRKLFTQRAEEGKKYRQFHEVAALPDAPLEDRHEPDQNHQEMVGRNPDSAARAPGSGHLLETLSRFEPSIRAGLQRRSALYHFRVLLLAKSCWNRRLAYHADEHSLARGRSPRQSAPIPRRVE